MNPESKYHGEHIKSNDNEDIVAEEAESIISDRCWEPRHKSDSHSWILRDSARGPVRSERLSTMKNTYRPPDTQEQPTPVIGKRTKILMERMLREAEAEAMEQRELKPAVEKYITTYDETYCATDPDFKPEPPPRERDLYEKYPLYGNPASTYWHFQRIKYVGEPKTLPGATAIADINNPFKKSTHFSKPIADLTDGGQLDR